MSQFMPSDREIVLQALKGMPFSFFSSQTNMMHVYNTVCESAGVLGANEFQ